MSGLARGSRTAAERGQVVVVFALLLPVILALSSVVIGLGNWYVHAKHLQTKADAGAIAGGGAFQFPCQPGVDAIDQGIAKAARQYSGPSSAPPVASPNPGFNPQVGGVGTPAIHAVLNGPNWYDDDGNPSPTENLDICDGSVGPNDPMRLEVKLTEDNSFPLASLIPLFPDIKRKAAVELFQTDGTSGLLPIAVRAPEPQSALAIFYDEQTQTILGREYFLKKTGPNLPPMPGLPAGLQGWSTQVSATDARGWASLAAQPHVGVVVAISYRGACGTWGGTAPPGPPPGLFVEPTGKCLEDGLGPGGTTTFSTVDGPNGICNQGGNVQVANCYFTNDPNGSVPNDEIVLSGLQHIRGYTPNSGPPTSGAPTLHTAYLSSTGCTTGYGSGYFTTFPSVCDAVMNATIDPGSCLRATTGTPPAPTGPCVASGVETRTAQNVEVKYTLVKGTGNNDDICNFGPTCDLADTGGPGSLSATGTVALPGGTQPPPDTRYAVALRVRFQQTFVQGKPDCSRQSFGGDCEFYFLGTGPALDSQPSNAAIFNNPVQRAFRGDTTTNGSIRWLSLKADREPCSAIPADETINPGEEGSFALGSTNCFAVEMGLKGGLASDADDQPFIMNDGIGASQLGVLDCTATGAQSITWELVHGCPPLYGPHSFNYTPLCPPPNALFTPTPPGLGPPWVDWPPIRCVKTRPTSQAPDLERGLTARIYYPDIANPPNSPPNMCPPQNGPGYTQGLNYWKHNAVTNPEYGYQDNDFTPLWLTNFSPKDTRVATIFLTTPDSFTGSGQNTYPITGAIGIYITGYGRIQGGGKNAQLVVTDPCAGPPPLDLDLSGGVDGGQAVWGHFINLAVLSASATPSSVACNPGASSQPCVAVLVD